MVLVEAHKCLFYWCSSIFKFIQDQYSNAQKHQKDVSIINYFLRAKQLKDPWEIQICQNDIFSI